MRENPNPPPPFRRRRPLSIPPWLRPMRRLSKHRPLSPIIRPVLMKQQSGNREQEPLCLQIRASSPSIPYGNRLHAAPVDWMGQDSPSCTRRRYMHNLPRGSGLLSAIDALKMKDERRIWDPDLNPFSDPRSGKYKRKRPHLTGEALADHAPGDLRELLPPRAPQPHPAPPAPYNAPCHSLWSRVSHYPDLRFAEPNRISERLPGPALPPEFELPNLRRPPRVTSQNAPFNTLPNCDCMQDFINSGHRIWAPGEVSSDGSPNHAGYFPTLLRVTPRISPARRIIQSDSLFERGRIMDGSAIGL